MAEALTGETVPEKRSQAWLDTQRSDKVSEIVARKILTDIVRRNLQPGTQLPSEHVLLDLYAVGRSSIREALRILEVHGVIRIKAGPGGGPVVGAPTSRDFGRSATVFFHAFHTRMGGLLEARLVLEPMLARLAAERVTPDGVAELEETLEAEREAVNSPMSEWGSATGDLHGVIAGMTGNTILDLFGRSIVDIYSERVRPIFPVGSRDSTHRIHRRIVRAITSGEPDEAERLMRAHLQALVTKQQELLPALVDELVEWR